MIDREMAILLVEDSETDAMLVARTLRKQSAQCVCERVDTADAMRAALTGREWDLIISDYAMPRFDGLAALKLARELAPDVPVVIVSGTVGEEIAVAAVKAGANDYVMKGNLTRLGTVVERELREAVARREHAAAQRLARETDERNRAIITTAAEGIITFDTDGTIESFNPAAERIFGYSMAEALGKHLSVLLPGEGAQQVIAAKAYGGEAGLEDGAGSLVELEGRRKDGADVSIEVAIAKHRAGQRGLFTAMVRDITERNQARDELRRQFEKLGALRAIDVAITGSLDLRVTMSIVLDQVAHLLQVDAATVLVVDPATGDLRCVAARGFRSDAVRRAVLRRGEGLPGRAVKERCLVDVPDLSRPEAEVARPELCGESFHAYRAVPLAAKGAVHGVLEVFHRSALETDPEWLSYLETLAGQAAIGLDSVLVFEELQRRNAELIEAYDNTIEGWARALDLRDKETEGHTRRVADLTVRLARRLGMSDEEVAHARRGAILHDVGKLGVPDHVLLKPGSLTDDERAIMQEHPGNAYRWLSGVRFLRPALDIPYCHHEKWDGSGYPRGLKGDAIPLAARMFAVVDVWDALTSDRPYREAWSPQRAIAHLQEQSGAHFDPDIVTAFLSMVLGDQAAQSAPLKRTA